MDDHQSARLTIHSRGQPLHLYPPEQRFRHGVVPAVSLGCLRTDSPARGEVRRKSLRPNAKKNEDSLTNK